MPKKSKKYKILEIFKFLWLYVKKYRAAFYLALFLSLSISLVESISPYVYGQVVDSFLGKEIIFNLSVPWLLLIWSAVVEVAPPDQSDWFQL